MTDPRRRLAMLLLTLTAMAPGCGRIGFQRVDGSAELDAATPDARELDAGGLDAQVLDAQVLDAETRDTGASDAAASDAAGMDAFVTDAGVTDAGTTDAGTTDAGTTDAGTTDAARDASARDAAVLDGGAASSVLVLNELEPQGDDYAELVNAGGVPLSLDGLSVADADGIGMPPADATHRTAFPAGITLAPGEHFLIAMNLGGMARSGLLTSAADCRGAPRCIQTSYGIAVDAGDSVAILDATFAVLTRADYAGSVPTGLRMSESWCRLPDTTGEFARCTPTPAAVNAP